MVVNFLKEKTAPENLAVLVRNHKNDLVQQYKNDNIEVKIGDYSNLKDLQKAFKNIDILYFISAGDDDGRAKLHKNVVDAAKYAGVKHIVYTSGVRKNETDSSPLASLIDSHIQTENFIKTSGIDYTILRHNLYAEVIEMLIGNRNQLLKSKTIYLPAGEGLTAFVPKENLAEAAVNIILNPEAFTNKILEFNSNEQINFSEIAETISEVLKENIQYISPDLSKFKSEMNKFGLSNHIIEILSTFSLAIANGEFDQKSADLETVLGHKTISLSEFLKKAYN